MREDLWPETDGDPLDVPADRHGPAKMATPPKDRHIGCPLWWFKLVFPVVWGKNQLAVALYLYRLRTVRGSRTVTVSNIPLLAELGIDRKVKYKALKRLAAAGIISLKKGSGQAPRVTFRKRKR